MAESSGAVNQDLLKLSETINEKYPYPAMICRSHSELVLIASIGFAAVTTYYFGRRIFLLSTFSSYVMTSLGISIIDYKWKQKK
jgi:hypothetical protein